MPNNGDENPQGEPNREQPSDTDVGCNTDIDEDETDLVPQCSLGRRVSLRHKRGISRRVTHDLSSSLSSHCGTESVDRSRTRLTSTFHGVCICSDTFHFVHGISRRVTHDLSSSLSSMALNLKFTVTLKRHHWLSHYQLT